MKSFLIKAKIKPLYIKLRYSNDIDDFIQILENNKNDGSRIIMIIKIYKNLYEFDNEKLKMILKIFSYKLINIEHIDLFPTFYYRITIQDDYGYVSSFSILKGALII